MYVRRLSLTDFRCYRRLTLTLPCSTVVVVGGNAQGKSSLLESFYVLATTRSPHASSDRELVHWSAGEEVIPFSRASGEIVRADEQTTVEVLNVRRSGEGDSARYSKEVRVNHAERRALDVLGLLTVVLFTPRDIDVVDGSPSLRRRYLDVLLCQIDRPYCNALSRYNRIVSQRNHLLRRLRDRGGDREELVFWDQRLARDAALLLARRLETTDTLGDLGREIHADLAGGATFEIAYEASLAEEAEAAGATQLALDRVSGDGRVSGLPRDRTALEELFRATLVARRDEEIARGVTFFGPHRDDLTFRVDGIDMRTYGSRGQQRTVTLALKLAEAQLMWTTTGERPVLLLDDVMSELDPKRRADLLRYIDPNQQTLITATELDVVPTAALDEALVLHLEKGQVTAAERDGRPVTPPTG